MLYIVATPIGNLEEMTMRAIKVLKEVDVIYAEDTRHTAVLLNHYDIKTPLRSYQKFSESRKTTEIIECLRSGKNVALVSDAGMPLVSDPGSVLVSKAREEGLEYTVISGACACVNALVLSGMDTSSFCMLGFLPEKNSAREKMLSAYREIPCTLIFYSPPHDILENLEYLYSFFGERNVSVVREISKIHEEVITGKLGSVPEFTVKGEFVIVLEGAKKRNSLNELSTEEHYKHYIDKGMDKKEAIKAVANDLGVHKSDIYRELLTITQEK